MFRSFSTTVDAPEAPLMPVFVPGDPGSPGSPGGLTGSPPVSPLMGRMLTRFTGLTGCHQHPGVRPLSRVFGGRWTRCEPNRASMGGRLAIEDQVVPAKTITGRIGAGGLWHAWGTPGGRRCGVVVDLFACLAESRSKPCQRVALAGDVQPAVASSVNFSDDFCCGCALWVDPGSHQQPHHMPDMHSAYQPRQPRG